MVLIFIKKLEKKLENSLVSCILKYYFPRKKAAVLAQQRLFHGERRLYEANL
jgi:hypothetical protein